MISCFEASLNNLTELASKSIKLATIIEMIIEGTFIKFLPTILNEIHTIFSISSLNYFQVQFFPVPYAWQGNRWKLDYFLYRKECLFYIATENMLIWFSSV